ncbi:phosphonate transport system substrate-binding protein [Tistlia consotensis]|uniref:Phosphonate transport system substrate-binding protein n=2 Tax=Tistlia TaxID=1321364 RepID=A0A1Y6CAH5_9PROT|nr:phosphonate transport system substrate-binding protein [Tistlia consotensis USBA 355]SNR86732.1 phosphonate transport system substrate-binding protein [Tistlia consotensis]
MGTWRGVGSASAGGFHRMTRRRLLAGAAVAVALPSVALAGAGPLRFGLTPVFLTNDLDLLSRLKAYLSRSTGRPVELVLRRTYQEITALLVSDQLDAAWICGYPYVEYRQQLALLAIPIWQGRPFYQSYLITGAGRQAEGLADLAGDIHAFSDPNSNSGYLVTRALLAERGERPETFFRQSFFTYGHRNVVRAVASGLADSGSVDGYVWEVMTGTEPALTGRTRVARRSEWLGFPPVAAPRSALGGDAFEALQRAMLSMERDDDGRAILAMLRLDRFGPPEVGDYRAIAAKAELVRTLG